MTTQLPLTLALDLIDLVWIGMVLLITFGSGVANWVKKKAEEREAERRRERAMMSPNRQSQDAPDESVQASIGSDRAEQLRALARQRAQVQAQAQAGGASTQPRNLTMAERIARARAQQQYARRAKDLQGQAQQARQQLEAGEAQREAARQQREAARQRMQQEKAARRAAERQARAKQLRRQQQRQQQQLQQQQQAHRSRQRTPATTGHAARPAGIHPARRTQQKRTTTAPAARRSVRTPAAAPPTLVVPESTAATNLSRRSLRRAIVLKEILDRPVALRGPDDQGML